ncbi:hypothetical protein Vadar_021859 [Vaccinium darrowii]|uniref:Uncharacterized protein n=1 Tax=Vaccinium darrowii TaxID=229202 RepID=A0ACB7Z5Q6_9ERIC|nr:hypothetical protein Vadar_021859 [Vaccinium darrowii]
MDSQDPLEEVELGDGVVSNTVQINKELDATSKAKLIAVLKENKDCFAWSYKELTDSMDDHIEHLKTAFSKMKHYQLKLNLAKYAFGVMAGNFLGYLVHSKGKTKVFSSLLKLKDREDFEWTKEHDNAFKAIKEYLLNPPVLVPPKKGKPVKLYLAANYDSIGTDVMKYMLSQPILSGRIGKWIVSLIEFSLEYVPQKSVKGHALANFLADHPNGVETSEIADVDTVTIKPWKMWFDGSKTCQMAGIGMVLESPEGLKTKFGFQINEGECTNNQAEYEALITRLEILLTLQVDIVEVFGDSQLVINQVNGEFGCHSPGLKPYHQYVKILAKQFHMITFIYVPRFFNGEADAVAQRASGFKFITDESREFCQLSLRKSLPMLKDRNIEFEVCAVTTSSSQVDWRQPLIDYLTKPDAKIDRATRLKSFNYIIYNGDLFKRGANGLLLKCLSKLDAFKVTTEVHEGCQACQKTGPLKRLPVTELQYIVRGWVMDMIGMIYPPSRSRDKFILVATDYFTKWVEAQAFESVTLEQDIEFINGIIYRFGSPETITAESTNKIIKRGIQRMVDRNPEEWPNMLLNVL